jgi:fumarate reductase subunit D
LTPHRELATVGGMRAARRIVVIVLLVQFAWAVPLGLVLGATLDWNYALAFCGAALAVLVVLLSLMLAWQRADAVRERLLASGTRVPATLVSSRATGTRVNRKVVQAHTFESHAAGRVIRAEARAFAHLPVGTEATIAYDTTDPRRATVVEDLDAMAAAGQLDWQALRRRQAGPLFRERP